MAKEYFWGTTLSKDKKVCKWDPESEFLDDDDDDDDYAISHFLFLKQAVLGAEVEDTERNVVEVETVNFDGDKVKQPLFSLKLGLNESTPLDMGLQPPVTFKLVKGSGPVFLSGQHALDLQEDEDFGEDFKEGEGEELSSDEDVDEKEVEEEEKVKKVSTKGKDKKKAAVKDVKVPKKGKGDELDEDEDEEDEDEDEDEDEEEEEEKEEKQTAKGKKRPAPSAKGPAKKLAKVDKDGKSKKKVPNGSIKNGHADDDDEDDEEDEDYKVEDEEEEEATSGEEEEEEEEEDDEEMALGDEDDEDDDEEDDEDDEGMDDEDEEDEDEEEESSPEKPVKKAKGKVNGTVKPKGTPKSQQSKSKEKKTFTMDDMKQDLIKSPSKPKKEDKFKNFVKSRFHLSEAKKIQELWGWYKSTQLK